MGALILSDRVEIHSVKEKRKLVSQNITNVDIFDGMAKIFQIWITWDETNSMLKLGHGYTIESNELIEAFGLSKVEIKYLVECDIIALYGDCAKLNKATATLELAEFKQAPSPFLASLHDQTTRYVILIKFSNIFLNEVLELVTNSQ